jgi:hypothetical protein
MIGRVCCSSAMIGAAVDSTLEAGTASFTMELNSSPGGITMRYRGVCDFTHQRLAAHVDVETEPADPSDEPAGGFQVVDGGAVYFRNVQRSDAEEQWHVADVGGWVAAGPLAVLGWLYGVEDVQATGRAGVYVVTMSGRRAVDAGPDGLRDGMRHAFVETGQIDADATGVVRLDDRNRVTEFRLDVPEGCRGADGTVYDAARFVLVLADFGLPALIEPPDRQLPG